MDTQEYLDLKKFMGLFYDWYEKKPHHPPQAHPVIVLSQLESRSPAKARSGLQMAINDLIESTLNWELSEVQSADVKMTASGAPSLSQVRAKYSRKFAQLLKRGKIKNVEEYYLAKGIIDGAAYHFGDLDRNAILSMLEKFEQTVSWQQE